MNKPRSEEKKTILKAARDSEEEVDESRRKHTEDDPAEGLRKLKNDR